MQTAANGGSEPLIFVPRAAHRHDQMGWVGADWTRHETGLVHNGLSVLRP